MADIISEFPITESEEINLAKDVLQQSHTLIAGTTGSGKSTALDTILYEMHKKSDMAFLIIDLKRVSAIKWKDSPLCVRYATEPSTANKVLDEFISVMELHYKKMEARQIEKWDGYHYFLVVDECADLLDTVKHSYDKLKKIARLGRAAGMHLILCSQSPSRKVLPADLTLNLNARLGLRCNSAIESRQIIGDKGCEDLPMYGVGLYKTPQFRTPTSITITSISKEDIEKIIKGKAKI